MNKVYTNALSPGKVTWLGVLVLLGSWLPGLAQNYVPSGGEAVNFGVISLTTSTVSPYWSTDRTAAPGYFSGVGTATYTGGADANFNVNGYMKWYGTASGQSFTAPVGDGSQLRSLTISGSTANGDIFGVAWWTGSPSSVSDPTGPNAGMHPITSLGTGISSVSPLGFWDWQDVSGTGAGRTVTVDIPDLSAFSTAANLRLVGWNGTQWVNLSGATGATGNTNHSTLSGTMLAGITAIALGSTASLVPDLTPLADIDDLNFGAGQSRDFTANIFEIIGVPTSGTVSFRVTRISGWDITVPGITLSATDQSGVAGTSNVGGGTPHENDKWLFRQNSGFITVTLKTGNAISGFGTATLGFVATRKAGTPAGTTQNISLTVVTGSGGEVDVSNNLSVTSITAN